MDVTKKLIREFGLDPKFAETIVNLTNSDIKVSVAAANMFLIGGVSRERVIDAILSNKI